MYTSVALVIKAIVAVTFFIAVYLQKCPPFQTLDPPLKYLMVWQYYTIAQMAHNSTYEN